MVLFHVLYSFWTSIYLLFHPYCMMEFKNCTMYSMAIKSYFDCTSRKGYWSFIATCLKLSFNTALWTWAREAAAIAFLSNVSNISFGFIFKSSSIITFISSYGIGGAESWRTPSTLVNYQGTTLYKLPKYWPSFMYTPLLTSLSSRMRFATLVWIWIIIYLLPIFYRGIPESCIRFLLAQSNNQTQTRRQWTKI